jgi:hypothetical protein
MYKTLILFIIFFPALVYGQSKYTVSGYVTDAKSGEQLTGATIYNAVTGNGATTNNYGFFSLTLPEGNCTLEFRFLGFQHTIKTFDLKADTLLSVALKKGVEIEEVQVTGHTNMRNNPELSGLNQPRITMKMIESAPVIMSETDVLKTLQFLPGIKQGAENTASFNVRGGSGDQNLILLDGVPVYNVNHLLGFFSVFNTDAIKNVNLIKGGIPARYGGRLSSVLDITMKEGNLNKSSGVVSISPIAGRFTFEAPIKRDTGAFIVSLRRTLFDLPWYAIQNIASSGNNFGYYFYDFNAKANWIFNPKSRIYISIYTGKDNQYSNTKEDVNTNSHFSYNWGNFTSVMRWNQVLSSKLFANTSVYYSHFYHNEIGKAEDEKTKNLFQTSSDLQDFSVQTDFDFYASPGYTLRFGGKMSHLIFNPNIVQIKSVGTNIKFNDQNKGNANQADIYLENAFDLGKLKLNVGGRLSGYFTGNTNYLHFQPRISANVQLAPGLNMAASYTEMVQNIHLLTNSSLGMPTDLWVASTEKIGPQTAQQATLGFSKQINNSYSFDIEGYYKWMENVVRFDEGASFTETKENNWENSVLVGDGKAYGIEMAARKEKGSFTGILSYTLSWSERRFDKLNHGNWFPDKYDRRHDVSVLAEYSFKEKYKLRRSVSLGFTLQSGNNISLPDVEHEGLPTPGRDSSIDIKNWEVIRQTYDNPNNFKMPVFHHLDLGYSSVKQKNRQQKHHLDFFGLQRLQPHEPLVLL